MNVRFSIRSFVRLTVGAIAVFALMHFFVKYQELACGRQRLFGLNHLFDLNGEMSLPAWYQTMTLLLASGLTAFIAAHMRRMRAPYAKRWALLAVIFLAMSIDEMTALHEHIGDDMIGPAIGSYGHFHSPWLLIGIPFVILFAFMYLRFFFALPASDRTRFFWAAFVYLLGVIVIEIPENLYSARHGEQNLIFAAFTGVEECLEMSGMLLLNLALLKKMEALVKPVRLTVEVDHG